MLRFKRKWDKIQWIFFTVTLQRNFAENGKRLWEDNDTRQEYEVQHFFSKKGYIICWCVHGNNEIEKQNMIQGKVNYLNLI